jgi:hypothetical protein
LAHHVRQLMLVGIRIHIKWAKLAKPSRLLSILRVEYQVQFNIALECRPAK